MADGRPFSPARTLPRTSGDAGSSALWGDPFSWRARRTSGLPFAGGAGTAVQSRRVVGQGPLGLLSLKTVSNEDTLRYRRFSFCQTCPLSWSRLGACGLGKRDPHIHHRGRTLTSASCCPREPCLPCPECGHVAGPAPAQGAKGRWWECGSPLEALCNVWSASLGRLRSSRLPRSPPTWSLANASCLALQKERSKSLKNRGCSLGELSLLTKMETSLDNSVFLWTKHTSS